MKTNIYRIAAFVWKHYPPARDWGAELLLRWLSRVLEAQTCMAVIGNDGQIKGLAIVRTMMKADVENELHSLFIDPEGDTYLVDIAIALEPKLEVLQMLGFMGLKRFGQRRWMAFQKNGQGPVKFIDARKHRAKIMRKHREHAC